MLRRGRESRDASEAGVDGSWSISCAPANRCRHEERRSPPPFDTERMGANRIRTESQRRWRPPRPQPTHRGDEPNGHARPDPRPRAPAPRPADRRAGARSLQGALQAAGASGVPDLRRALRARHLALETPAAGASEHLCPACHRIKDKYPAGHVTLEGKFLAEHRDEIMQLVHNEEARAKAEHPMERIMAIEQDGGKTVMTTTDLHLAAPHWRCPASRLPGHARHQVFEERVSGSRTLGAVGHSDGPRRRSSRMPWNEDYYPPAMEHLSPVIRSKAIEIANALLEEGHDEGFAIRVGHRPCQGMGRAAGLDSEPALKTNYRLEEPRLMTTSESFLASQPEVYLAYAPRGPGAGVRRRLLRRGRRRLRLVDRLQGLPIPLRLFQAGKLLRPPMRPSSTPPRDRTSTAAGVTNTRRARPELDKPVRVDDDDLPQARSAAGRLRQRVVVDARRSGSEHGVRPLTPRTSWQWRTST